MSVTCVVRGVVGGGWGAGISPTPIIPLSSPAGRGGGGIPPPATACSDDTVLVFFCFFFFFPFSFYFTPFFRPRVFLAYLFFSAFLPSSDFFLLCSFLSFFFFRPRIISFF